MTAPIDLMPAPAIATLPPITLAALNDAAALQTRIDRKYIVGLPELGALVDDLAGRLAALEIDGRRAAAYESVYFDTDDLACFHDAAYKRRRRCKVRTRTYLDSATTMLEVKTKGARKVTVKQRQPHAYDARAVLDTNAASFVDAVVGRPGFAATLRPMLTTRYDRTTLVDLDDVARLTIDTDLSCVDPSGRSVSLDGRFVVETKSGGAPSAADRWLWAHGHRPEKVSKFCTGLAALDPSLPANRWHRTLQRHFRA